MDTSFLKRGSKYPVRAIEEKWRQNWHTSNAFKTRLNAKDKKKFYYILEMFPYPSGNIHMGHVRNYTLGDVIARFRRARGYEVLHPMGWDAFGLPAENAAIKNKSHPRTWTENNIAHMRGQLQSMGFSYDWSREIVTCDPGYFKHEQAMFLKLMEQGLVYRKEASVNWDPVENTVLANEQVVDGRGWRSGALVERRKLSQWFLKITHYAQELREGLNTLPAWPEKVKTMQERWLGKSDGVEVYFTLVADHQANLTVFTTRPEVLFGASFVALAADHPIVQEKALTDPLLAVFCQECQQVGTCEAVVETIEIKGFPLGINVQHPFNSKLRLPVYVANFVVTEYGTGAVYGCPAHDQHDLEFARKYNLPVIPVVLPPDADTSSHRIEETAYTGDGILYNSDFFNGLSTKEAKALAIQKLESLKLGKAKTVWRLRDWGVSRQRYWGCPIPVIHCHACGIVPLPYSHLPVTLPDDINFSTPGNPLDHHPTWKHTLCPACGSTAIRETDTLDTFFESSWYFARFLDPHNEDKPVDALTANTFLPVNTYIGGVEHAVLHLLYARFFTKALRDCGYWNVSEPFEHLLTQGMICHATYKNAAGEWLFPNEVYYTPDNHAVDKDGMPVVVGRSEKMSKSLKNVVDPEHILHSYGVDTARLFMLSDSPPERDIEWTDNGIDGAWRYVNRIYRLYSALIPELTVPSIPVTEQAKKQHSGLYRLSQQTIAAVTTDIENFQLNRSIARLREYSNFLEDYPIPDAQEDKALLRKCLEIYLQLAAPFLPHLCEELWSQFGYKDFIFTVPWPEAEQNWLKQSTVTLAVQVNGKLRGTITVPVEADSKTIEALALEVPTVQKALSGAIKKVVIVPGRVVNVVA